MSGGLLFDESLGEYVMAAHCLQVLSYTADYETGELNISAEQQGRRLQMRFEELLAHQFNHAGRCNVIYDVATVSLDAFITAERRELTRTLRYGFPLREGRGPDELRRCLSEGGYSVFRIRASVGMCGFVIAKRLVIEEAAG